MPGAAHRLAIVPVVSAVTADDIDASGYGSPAGCVVQTGIRVTCGNAEVKALAGPSQAHLESTRPAWAYASGTALKGSPWFRP